MYTDNKGVFKVLIIAILLAFAFSFYEAFVLMFCWNKVVPAVTNFPMINYWGAFGISLVIDIFRITISSADKNKESDDTATVVAKIVAKAIIESIILGLVALVSLGI